MARNGVVCRRLRTEVKQAHVLAVDDSLVDRKVIEKLLRISSYKVTVVDSGRRALQFLGLDEDQSSVVGGLKVDLIITDYCMPGMTGYELLKKIKESSTFKEVPVVIMSSENVFTKINRCLEEGAEDYFVKPVKLDDVKRLKEYMMREDKSTAHKSRINKRKSMDGSDDSTSSSSTSDSRSPSPRTSTESSPSTSSETRSASPSGPLDSPTRRRRISIDDPNVAES